eukprot:SAG11_NODE_17670_length_512_cov_0.731235_1_plen_53_part_10
MTVAVAVAVAASQQASVMTAALLSLFLCLWLRWGMYQVGAGYSMIASPDGKKY